MTRPYTQKQLLSATLSTTDETAIALADALAYADPYIRELYDALVLGDTTEAW